MATLTSHQHPSHHLQFPQTAAALKMPHAVDTDNSPQDEQDDQLISELLNAGPASGNSLDFLNRELEPGEKANDAEDFEDIGDDDLAEDEDAQPTGHVLNGGYEDEDTSALNGARVLDDQDRYGEDDHAFDDLFGDRQSSPVAETGLNADESQDLFETPAPPVLPLDGRLLLPGVSSGVEQQQPVQPYRTPSGQVQLSYDTDYGVSVDDDPELREQRELFAQAQREREERLRRGGNLSDLPAPPQSNAELFETIWPHFEPGKPPRFHELLGVKRAFYLEKKPLKPPKPIQPTKVDLELMQDQERSFKLPPSANPSKAERQAKAEQDDIIFITDSQTGQHVSEDEIELDPYSDTETVGGVNLFDLSILCEDWEVHSYESLETSGRKSVGKRVQSFSDDEGWQSSGNGRPAKRRKSDEPKFKLAPYLEPAFPLFDEPEETTSKLARKVTLDLNDPDLLIDVQKSDALNNAARKVTNEVKRDAGGNVSKDLKRKYNISNDEAYDLLKENHQHKVRSTLGNLTIEHSLPAVKLQYPFYKVKLTPREARSFHRPTMIFVPNQAIRFSKARVTKRKHLKGRDTQSIFAKAEDLSMGDNSNVLLLEYSEEYPTMISNFGMGSRLINYYRRKDMEDTSRPKLEVGETAVLLPQDKSPFSIFGNIEPGQVMPTLHNGLYRAPVFKQDVKPTDFLVCRSTTGINGSHWYLRNIESLFVVGQEFPSVEVPGTHSRKVTEAAKRRLKMISYRIYKKNRQANVKGALLSNEMIRAHLPGTDIAQNRGKMREFMAYDKETGSWIPKKGDVIPDALTMREWIRPEDVCLLDAMQVGDRHLQDAGYNKDEREVDGDDDDEKEGQSLEQQLAPWQTTKNFLNACQGKAMLQLHGEGDPSGRGEAFSFIKTSMKGGFKAIGESVEDKLDAKKLKETGGHSYNVARQQRAYEEAIKKIWEAQRLSLSSTIEHSDTEGDVDNDEPDTAFSLGKTPHSEAGTPAPFPRRDDESASQFSRFSTGSQKGKVLKITRHVNDKYGKLERVEEIVSDPKVIREYIRRRKAQELNALTISELKPTGDADYDERQQKMLMEELARLERNKERRHAREKAKGMVNGSATSPGTPASPSALNAKNAGTQRRCANCGQVGHIKTNKKLCPLLNGKPAQEDAIDESAFGSSTAPPAPALSEKVPSPLPS